MVSTEYGIFDVETTRMLNMVFCGWLSGSWKNAMFQEDVSNHLISLDPWHLDFKKGKEANAEETHGYIYSLDLFVWWFFTDSTIW